MVGYADMAGRNGSALCGSAHGAAIKQRRHRPAQPICPPPTQDWIATLRSEQMISFSDCRRPDRSGLAQQEGRSKGSAVSRGSQGNAEALIASKSPSRWRVIGLTGLTLLNNRQFVVGSAVY